MQAERNTDEGGFSFSYDNNRNKLKTTTYWKNVSFYPAFSVQLQKIVIFPSSTNLVL